jgi:hypothetical protein
VGSSGFNAAERRTLTLAIEEMCALSFGMLVEQPTTPMPARTVVSTVSAGRDDMLSAPSNEGMRSKERG